MGGFLAESASDFMQAIVMIIALAVILALGVVSAGGVGKLIENARGIPGFFEMFGVASPVTVDGVQQTKDGIALFGEAGKYGFLTILSTMSWGLGYFGMPQVLLRFMAIRDERELKKSRRVGTVWCVISLFSAVLIGVAGRVLYPSSLVTASGAENVFILLSKGLLPSLLAGFVMAGILAATISSSDSYLLIAASAFSKNIF
jgi:sodium/proline symporter